MKKTFTALLALALAALTLGQTPRLIATQARGALRQRRQPQGGAHRRRLARPVWPAQGNHLAQPHRQGRAFQHINPADADVCVL